MKSKSFISSKKRLNWFINKFLNLFLIFCGVVLVWILLQVTSIATFKIPSDSMEPALLAGDNILVNKWVMGARIFNIEDAHYRVRGCETPLGNVESQDELMRIVANGRENDYGIVMSGYPYNGLVDWDIVRFGPLYLPAKGDGIGMNPKHAALYRNAIEWEQKKKLTLRGDTILLNDSVIHTYRFKENYYFVTGDKVMNSQDSRYWGLLPEPFIVGKAVRI